jgi:hypothetical protein
MGQKACELGVGVEVSREGDSKGSARWSMRAGCRGCAVEGRAQAFERMRGSVAQSVRAPS